MSSDAILPLRIEGHLKNVIIYPVMSPPYLCVSRGIKKVVICPGIFQQLPTRLFGVTEGVEVFRIRQEPKFVQVLLYVLV